MKGGAEVQGSLNLIHGQFFVGLRIKSAGPVDCLT